MIFYLKSFLAPLHLCVNAFLTLAGIVSLFVTL